MPKVLVGMSGGVDSAVAALLLKQAGYEVVGATLRTWVSSDGQESRCCEIDDARETAKKIGIPYHVFNCVSDFDEQVIRPFIRDYLNGLTPNPCVGCNRTIKWEKLLHYADVLGADFVATGHYAAVRKLENGRITVMKALHAEKDQTYMLYRLSQEQLRRTLMPLGGYSKQEVRAIAAEAGLEIASKADSQEICFVTDGDYADFIRKNAGCEIPGEGNFVDESGRILGVHKGLMHYTVGQRKRLGIALGHPAYIREIRPDTNEIVLGRADETYCRGIRCLDMNFMSIPEPGPGEKIRCQVKVRYRHPGQPAAVEKAGDGLFDVTFEEPVRSAAPGQSAVFYDGDGCVIGGGVIAGVRFSERDPE